MKEKIMIIDIFFQNMFEKISIYDKKRAIKMAPWL